MPIKVTCSNCGGVLHAPDDAGGKKGRCPTCGNVLPIPSEAPRVAAAPLPAVADAPGTKAHARSQSFGEFGPNSPTDGHVTAAPPRASTPAVADKRRASVPLPPPNVDAPRSRVGFGTNPDGTEGGTKGWKRVSRGLWWVRAGVFFLLLPFVLLNGLKVYEHLAKPLPVKDPGYAGIPWLSSVQEIEVAAIGVPLILGLPMLLLGRLGVSNAPKRSRTGGLASLAAFATLVAVLGGVVFLMPAVAMVATEEPGKTPPFLIKLQNQPPHWQMFTTADTEGLMQRGGILLGFFGLALAELWFLASVGRIGTALDSPKLAARATRMTVVYGIFLVAAFVFAVGAFKPNANQSESGNDFVNFTHQISKLSEDNWKTYGQPQFDKLGEYKPIARPALNVVLALFIGLGYFRMVGAGRGAVRNWLEANERP